MDTNQLQRLHDEKGTVLVEFFATWCPHCRRMMPVVDDLRALFAGSVAFYQFDIDQNQTLADKLDVDSLPTFIIYRGGEEMWRASGEMPGETLSAEIQKYIK